MPKVGKKTYPYTPAGKKAAKKAAKVQGRSFKRAAKEIDESAPTLTIRSKGELR